MEVFVNGCATCGYVGHLVRRIQRLNPAVAIRNSRYDADARARHAQYLIAAKLPADTYAPIVVDGETITRLELWNTPS